MKTTASTDLLKRLLLFFLLFAGLHYAKPFLVPFLIGAIIATLFSPLCSFLEKKHIPKFLAVTLCVLLFLLLLSGVIALFGWQVSELTQDVAVVKQVVTDAGTQLQEYILIKLGIPPEKQNEIIQQQQSAIISALRELAGSTAAFFVNFILVVAYIFLFLFYRAHIRESFLKLFSPLEKEELQVIIINATHVAQQYLIGLIKMIVCLWIMYFIGFSIVGVKNALFFAIICGLLEIIPYVGNLTGTSLTVLVAAVHGASLAMIGGIIITYGLVQFIQGWILEPIIVGPQVRINPFATIVALVIGELIWGIPGVILAIPIIGMFKIICDHVEALKPYGHLIGEIESIEAERMYLKRFSAWFRNKFS